MTKRTILVLAVIAGVAIVAAVVWALIASTPDVDPTATPPTVAPTTSATPQPTPAETPAESAEPAPPEPMPEGSADVVIVLSEWNAANSSVEVSGYVANVVEDDGKCTVTAKGPTTAQASQTARADAATTSCGLIKLDGASLDSGTYTVTLSYTSENIQGTSDSVDVVVEK